MKKRFAFMIAFCTLIFFTATLCACTKTQATEMQDGYYSAEAAVFDEHGWKELVTIYVNNHKIVTVEYNAKNASGFIKSWDMNYKREMDANDGTYPSKYGRDYAAMLLSKQSVSGVDAISGATHSFHKFVQLAEASIARSREGDKSVAFVDFAAEQ